MISIDLTQAYFHAKISSTFQKYLFFQWNKESYKFCVLPNGLVSGPRIFVHMTKAITCFLRKSLVDILIYIDDSFLCASNEIILHKNAQLTIDTFKNCGFTINQTKSNLQLTTELEFLGFDINTVKFQISLTSHKRTAIESLSHKIHNMKVVSIRELAKLIGLYVETFPATIHGQLHYRRLEQFKIKALHGKNMNWNAKVTLNKCCKHDISWWIHNIWSDKFTRSLHANPLDVCLYTDSSKDGGGAALIIRKKAPMENFLYT